jgi:hypothetical protein
VTVRKRCRFPAHTAAMPLLAMVALLGPPSAIAADMAPVALVMEVSGAMRPPLAVHREIAPGTRVTLEPEARVALLHYAMCSIVTVTGGAVTVTEQGLDVDAAARQSAKPGPCPRVHRIALTGPAPLGGVVVSRTIGVATPPVVVAAGGVVLVAGSGVVTSAVLLDDAGKSVQATLAVRDGSVLLPETLPLRRPYLLRMQIQGRSEAVDVPFSTSGPAAGGMLVLRLE